MDKKVTVSRVGHPLLDFALFVLLFSYPVLSLLWRRSYPLLTTEVLLLFLAVVGISLVLSLLTSRVRPAVAHLLIGVSILVAAMVQFNLLIEGVVLGIALLTLLVVVLRDRFRSFCVVILAALILGAYLDSGREANRTDPEEVAEATNTDLGPVIQILLDGFIGVGGLPDYPASDLIREKILSFFETNGFHLYTHAYSRYSTTGDSLYSSMNFRHDGNSVFSLEYFGKLEHVMQSNAVFTALEDLGYRLNVYQTSHLDLCQSNREKLDRCWQYDHPNINSVRSVDDTRFRLRTLYTVLLSQSRLLSSFIFGNEWGPEKTEIAVHDPQVFTELNKDLAEKAPGNYFFAHALIPHGPYAYQPDCSVSYAMPREYRVASQKNEVELPPIFYEIRNGLFFAQAECALRTLQSLFDNLKQAGLYDRSVIILHGDHGSHITRLFTMKDNAARYSSEDYRAAYSTLFAVKYPGSEFAIDERVLPTSYLLEEFMARIPTWTLDADTYPAFNPSGNAEPDKVDPYVYFQGSYPLHRVDVNIFSD